MECQAPKLYFINDLQILSNHFFTEDSGACDEFEIGVLFKTGTHSMVILEVAIHGSLGVSSFLSYLEGIFLLHNDLSDDLRFVADATAKILQAADVGEDLIVEGLPSELPS